MAEFFERLFGREHHESRLNRFMKKAEAAAAPYRKDLHIEIGDLISEMSAETSEAARYFLADPVIRDLIQRQIKIEKASAKISAAYVWVTGDKRERMAEANADFDKHAAEEGGQVWGDSGTIEVNPARKLTMLGPKAEDFPAYISYTVYLFKEKTVKE